MKKLYTLALAICGLCLMQGSASALNLDFKLKNNTGYVITKLFISPHYQRSWGENVLSSPLRDGEQRGIYFPARARARIWDLKVVYSNGVSEEWTAGFDFGSIYNMTLYYDDNGAAQANYQFVSS